MPYTLESFIDFYSCKTGNFNWGVLAPTYTTEERNTVIQCLEVPLLIYNSDQLEFQYWDGSIWNGLAGTFNGSITYPKEEELSLNGTVHNLELTEGVNTVVFVNQGFTITGIANNGLNIQVSFINETGNNVTFSNENGNSLEANRFSTQGGNFILGNGKSVTLRWSKLLNRWKYISQF